MEVMRARLAATVSSDLGKKADPDGRTLPKLLSPCRFGVINNEN